MFENFRTNKGGLRALTLPLKRFDCETPNSLEGQRLQCSFPIEGEVTIDWKPMH